MKNNRTSTTSAPAQNTASSPLQSRIDRHLLMCSVAVGATVAVTAGAKGAVVYQPENIPVPATTSFSNRVYIDLDTFAVTTGATAPTGSDISFLDILAATASGYFKYNRIFAIGATTTTGTVLDAQTTNQVGNTANFGAGISVNSASPFHQYGALAQHFYSSGGRVYNYGNFTTTGTSYIGFDFTSNGVTKNGWMQVNFNAANYAANTSALTILGIAYDTTGAPIATGAVPEPGPLALGCLAAGAVGLGLWRRQRAAATVAAQA